MIWYHGSNLMESSGQVREEEAMFLAFRFIMVYVPKALVNSLLERISASTPLSPRLKRYDQTTSPEKEAANPYTSREY